jgi:hypothetical protein
MALMVPYINVCSSPVDALCSRIVFMRQVHARSPIEALGSRLVARQQLAPVF